VRVTGFVQPGDDPHVVEPTAGMIESLAEANLLVIVGLGLEAAWLPGMIEQARNDAIRRGNAGHLDLSTNLRTIVGPEGRGVRGSFHPEDNPHYLLDPVEGVKAGRAIADRLTALAPDHAQAYESNFTRFAKPIMTLMLGPAIAERHDPDDFEALAVAVERDELAEHLREHGRDAPELGGWLGRFEPFRDTPVVGDHDLWPYFARRYGVRVLGYLEPEPGVPPTAPHLNALIQRMRQADCRVILTIPYFDQRHARFVAGQTDVAILPMAHQPGSRPDTATYSAFVEYNAAQLHEALLAARDEVAR